MIDLETLGLRLLGEFFLKQSFHDRGSLHRVGRKMGKWVNVRYFQRSLNEVPREREQLLQTEGVPVRHWWSSLFRRRRRRRTRRTLRD